MMNFAQLKMIAVIISLLAVMGAGISYFVNKDRAKVAAEQRYEIQKQEYQTQGVGHFGGVSKSLGRK